MRRGTALAGTVSAVLLLAGCGGNPAPKPLPKADSPSATASASPSATPPALPEEANASSDVAAKAFVRHFVALVNYASDTGDTQPLRSASGNRCGSCSGIADFISRTYQAGGRITSDGWSVQSFSTPPGQPPSRKYFDLVVREDTQSVVPSAGASAKHYGGGTQNMTIILRRTQTAWLVTELDLST